MGGHAIPKNNLVTGTKSDDLFEEAFKFVLLDIMLGRLNEWSYRYRANQKIACTIRK